MRAKRERRKIGIFIDEALIRRHHSLLKRMSKRFEREHKNVIIMLPVHC